MDKKGLGFILLAVACYGLSSIIAKFAYRGGANFVTLLAFRYLLSSVLLWLTCRKAGLNILLPLPDRKRILTVASVGSIGYCALYYRSLELIPAGVASLLMYTYPTLVLLISVCLGTERMDARKGFALLLALAGSAAVAGTTRTGVNLTGAALAFGSAALYAFYVVGMSRYTSRYDSRVVTLYVAFPSGAFYLLYGLLTDRLVYSLTPAAWIAIAAAGLIPSMLGGIFFFRGLSRVGAFRASFLRTLEPVYATVLAALLFRERLALPQIAGGVLILSGVVLSILARQSARAAKPQDPAVPA